MTKIYIAGHRGMVGRAILRQLMARCAAGADLALVTRSSAELDLTDQVAVRDFMAAEKPDVVILAAAKVGGIVANNTYPAQFIYENLMMACNVIHQAHAAGVQRLLQLGSSCIYPREAPQPMAEDALLTGPLEPTNEPYAVAKIAGIKLCESYNRQYGRDYRSVMPTNLYGPGDNFHPENSHVMPAMIQRFHTAARDGAEEVVIWGSGKPMREFLHVDDMAAASLFVMDLDRATYDAETEPMLSHINVGTGQDVTILELAQLVARVTGFAGRIVTDPGKPDGAPRKLMDVSRLARMGWTAGIELEEGVAQTYAWYLDQLDKGAAVRTK
ncbi:GDP-L-fucose synthase [Loktanella atrilutea]|uniref:GDP-L-fucose synthase n=1 Tax=Loktanella atrilutea TaxID=366533 RepID=A0A1M5EJV6_LOKAT|nr:GDP-L-fucose synthase [Loktanella atrilutea]SHF79424.1 GDP-L-fucose synthase [Loktanella atrilutea]